MAWEVSPDPLEFEEAVDSLLDLAPMTREDFENLDEEARKRAWTISNISFLDIIKDTLASLARAVERGVTFEEWKSEISETLESAWEGDVANPASRMETIFRTTTQTAYSKGHQEIANHPDIREDRPFWRFVASLDGDTTDVCREAHGTILPADHPWWQDHTPPLHFNCRSTFETLTSEEAERLGITEKPTELPPGKGFGAPAKLEDHGENLEEDWEERVREAGPLSDSARSKLSEENGLSPIQLPSKVI